MDKGSTLVGVEKRLAPIVLGVCALCAVIGLLALVYALPQAPSGLLVPCALAWLIPTGSNVIYALKHSRPSVGMIPPSLVSLGPATLPGILAPGDLGATSALLFVACAVATGAALAMIVLFCRMRATYGHSPAIPNDAVIIVLGGAIKQGKPCKTLALRLNTAVRVWQEHPSAHFVLTGGVPAGEELSEADIMARYMCDCGVPQHNLLIENQARNTVQNLKLSLQLIQDEQLEGQLCVLSSNYHLYRAVRTGKALGVGLVPIPAPTPRGSMLQQWCREALTILARG